jgi:outer membrane autotransporter protein
MTTKPTQIDTGDGYVPKSRHRNESVRKDVGHTQETSHGRPRFTLEPFVGADYNELRTRGFSESGGDAALNGEGDRNGVATTTLGLHAQTTFELSQGTARLRGTVGWRHAYGDVNPETTMSFDGSQAFTVAGAPLARNAAVVELGADVAMNKYATIGIAYSGQFGSGNQQNTGSVNFGWRF